MSPGIRRPFKPDGCTSLHVKPVILGPGKLLRWRPGEVTRTGALSPRHVKDGHR